MGTFKIEIRETLSRVIEIEADSNEDALLKTKQLYNKQEIVLDSSDFSETNIFEIVD